jgi:hypothetical protein
MMKKIILLSCFSLFILEASGVFAEESKTTVTLPLIIRQMCGQANTIVMWHDIDDDGKADYKATYVFKDGKLNQVSKNQVSQDDLGLLIRR